MEKCLGLLTGKTRSKLSIKLLRLILENIFTTNVLFLTRRFANIDTQCKI